MAVNKSKVDETNGFDISLEEKVENDGQSEMVYGQSMGTSKIDFQYLKEEYE